jgi:diguanylate cyclase (GGDEF)-like protein
LTGLLNRSGFEEFLFGAATRTGAASLAVLYIDVDHFKPINDTHGHAVGDEVLRELSLRLLSSVRGVDAVARLGGDEFAIALPAVADIETAVSVADKVVLAARHPVRLGGLTLTIGVSVGVAFQAERGHWKDLVARADSLAYEAKAAGRNRYFVQRR